MAADAAVHHYRSQRNDAGNSRNTHGYDLNGQEPVRPAAISVITLPRLPSPRSELDAAEPAPGPADVFGGLTVAQLARLITGVLWLAWAVPLAAQGQTALAPVLGTGIAGLSIGCIGAALLVRTDTARRALDAGLLAGTLALIVIVPLLTGTGGGYTTDELTFDQSAAATLLHGANPYATDYSSALGTFGVYEGQTMRISGSPVAQDTYPSLSFLLFVPAVALFGATSYAGMLVVLLAWAAAAWVLWRTLREPLRCWVPPLVLLPTFLGAVALGLTDSLFVPFELIAVTAWTRFTDRRLPLHVRLIGPAALGIACAIKQPAWFLAPFLLAGVALEAQRRQLPWRRFAAQYLATAAVAFLVPNLPFIVWDPGAWLHVVLLPLTGGLVPMGIGPAGLMRQYGIGGGNLGLFGVASAAALLGTFLLFIRFYPALRRVVPLLPAAALFLSTRSFETYFTFCVPALLVNAATLGPAQPAAVPRRVRRFLGVSGATCLGAACVAAIAGTVTPAPLRIAITSSTADSTTLHIAAVVHNAGSTALSPAFFLAGDAYFNQTVERRSGPATLAPGETASYAFTAVESGATPGVGEKLELQAGTSHPDAIATSNAVTVTAGSP